MLGISGREITDYRNHQLYGVIPVFHCSQLMTSMQIFQPTPVWLLHGNSVHDKALQCLETFENFVNCKLFWQGYDAFIYFTWLNSNGLKHVPITKHIHIPMAHRGAWQFLDRHFYVILLFRKYLAYWKLSLLLVLRFWASVKWFSQKNKFLSLPIGQALG